MELPPRSQNTKKRELWKPNPIEIGFGSNWRVPSPFKCPQFPESPTNSVPKPWALKLFPPKDLPFLPNLPQKFPKSKETLVFFPLHFFFLLIFLSSCCVRSFDLLVPRTLAKLIWRRALFSPRRL